MFTLDVEKGLKLALVHNSFASLYLDIVARERDYLGEWLAWPPYAHDDGFFLNFISRSLHDYADGKSLVCAIFYNETLVGNISFNSIDHDLKKVDIGYWISADYQGKGIVSKCVTKLITMAFTDLAMEKVEISVAVGNQSSRRVCKRLGFKLEGIITRAEKINGHVLDHAIYGLSRTEWR